MRKRVWLYVAIFAVAVAIYYPFSPAGRQRANMARADRHIETLAPRLAADPRLADVRLSSYTGQGGSLMVSGTVANKDDAAALRAIIQASKPPVEVAFRIIVEPAATQGSATRPER
jgi:hypothetical protein